MWVHMGESGRAAKSLSSVQGASNATEDTHMKANEFHNAVMGGFRSGVLVRPAKCSACKGIPYRVGVIQAHHPDYEKPLAVMWLCQRCHHAWHKTHRAIPRQEVMPDESFRAIETDVLSGGFP